MKPEALWWQSIREHLPRNMDRLDRIENEVGNGQPDVNGCLASEDAWIELKAPKEPARPTTKLISGNNHGLLISQENWFLRQRQAGGIAFILLRTDKRVLLLNGCDWAKTFNDATVNEMIAGALFHQTLPMKREQWELLRNVIFTASRYNRLHRHQSAQQLLAHMESGARLASDRGSRTGRDRAPPEHVAPGRAGKGRGNPRGKPARGS